MGKGRLEAFCDGVIAIAVTLMVLEMKVPHVPEGASVRDFWHAIVIHWPIYLATVVSFMNISCFWLNHHRLMAFVREVRHGLVVWTILLLFMLCLIPYATELLSDYILDPKLVFVVTPIYIGLTLVTGLVWLGLWFYIVRRKILAHTINGRTIRRETILYVVSSLMSIALLVVSFYHPYFSLVIYFVMLLFYFLPTAPMRASQPKKGEASS